MKINPIVDTIPQQAALQLGMVLAAHSNRSFCRAHATAAAASKIAAKHALDNDGLDARWFNETNYNECTGSAHEATRAKVAAEKYYRKQRLDFLAAYPNLAHILEELIPGSTQDYENKAQ
jgi:hypothetical protein